MVMVTRSPLGLERFARKVDSALSTITARDLMTKRPSVWPSALTVAELARSVLPNVSYSSFPTYGAAGELDGLVVLTRSLDLEPLIAANLRLADIAIPPEQLAIARPSTPLVELLSMPRARCAGRIIVLGTPYQAGHPEPLMGIITPSDLAFHLRGITAGGDAQCR